MQQLNELLNNTLRYLSLVIPISVLFMVLRKEVILILFQRGKFDAADTGQTAMVLIFMLVGSFAYAANTIVPRAYYATQDTLFPAIYGTVAVLLSIPLYWLGLNIMGTLGVALAASLSAILQVLILYGLWNRRHRNSGSRSVYRLYLKMMAFSAPFGVFLAWFKSTVLFRIDTSTFVGSLVACVVCGSVSALILLAAGYGLGIKEISDLSQRLRRKLRLARG